MGNGLKEFNKAFKQLQADARRRGEELVTITRNAVRDGRPVTLHMAGFSDVEFEPAHAVDETDPSGSANE